MIAYLQLPLKQFLLDKSFHLNELQGVVGWEMDTVRSAYISLEPWMSKRLVQHLYQALRGYYGPHIRFGAAAQKTTARAAALYRPQPHATIVTPEMTQAFLSQLPIQLLPGLGQRTSRFLTRRGIYTFDSFRKLSARTVKEWFGVSGLILQQFAQGIDPRVVEGQLQQS